MNTIRILTAWKQGKDALGRPTFSAQIHSDHPLVLGQDGMSVNATGLAQAAAGQSTGLAALPSPNLHVREMQVSNATLAAIQADTNYAAGILWVNDSSQPPTAAAYSALVALLSSKYGVLTAPVGLSAANTQAANEAAITSWSQSLASVTTGTGTAPSPPATVAGKVTSG